MERMKYGYARVSTDDQNPALQLAALKKAGCQTVFKDEGLSGATTKRPALLRCLKKLEHGDTLISNLMVSKPRTDEIRHGARLARRVGRAVRPPIHIRG